MRTLAVPVWGQGPCEGLQLCGYVLIQVIARQLSQIIVCVCSVVSSSLWCQGLYSTRLLCPWNSPGKNTGVGCHALPQGIFPTQESNPSLLRLLHWQAGSLPLVPLGSPQIHYQPIKSFVHLICFELLYTFWPFFLVCFSIFLLTYMYSLYSTDMSLLSIEHC